MITIMTDQDAINDNKRLDNGLDPDWEYVKDYLEEAVAHFKDCKIDRSTILNGFKSALWDIVPYMLAKPGRPVDESAMWSDLYFLWPLECDVAQRIKQRKAALDHAEAERATRRPALSESAD